MKSGIVLFVFVAVVAAAYVQLQEYRLIEIIGDDLLLKRLDTNDDAIKLKIPDGSVGTEIRSKFNAGKFLLCGVLTFNFQQIVAYC